MSETLDPGSLVWTGSVEASKKGQKPYTVSIYERGGVCSCPDYIIRGVNQGQSYVYACKHITRVRTEQSVEIGNRLARLWSTSVPPAARPAPQRSKPRPVAQDDPDMLSDDDLRIVGRRG